MTGPEDPAAAGRDRLRAGHADREQVIGTLKDAFVQGRLTRDELDARAGRALAARTCADLAALTADIPAADIPAADIPAADIPAAPAAAGPPCPPAPARRRPLARAAAGSGACLIIATAAMWAHPLLDPGARPTPYDGAAKLLFLVFLAAVVAALGILAYGVAASWELRRPRGQLPPGPGPGGHDLDGERRGGTGQDPDLPALRTDQTRADLRVHQSRPRRQHIPARVSRGERPAPGAA
jgi:hypothetical protein